jgi:hypothetical protein
MWIVLAPPALVSKSNKSVCSNSCEGRNEVWGPDFPNVEGGGHSDLQSSIPHVENYDTMVITTNYGSILPPDFQIRDLSVAGHSASGN